MRKVISIILTLCIVTTMSGTIVFAETGSNDFASMEAQKEAILDEHSDKINEIDFGTAPKTRSGNQLSNFEMKLAIQAETVEALNEIGYEAYDVNPTTFEEVQEILNTDLTDAGLKADGAYIVTLNEEGFIYPNALVSDPFSHTYNGTTYTLRWLTVRASDDPAFRKATTEILMEETSVRQTILNAVDTGIYAWLGAVSSVTAFLGTVGSILGISVSDLNDASDATFSMQASTEWTQRYAQVWSDYDQAWLFGSCVEDVEVQSRVSGLYFDNNIVDFVRYEKDSPEQTKYSARRDDYQWRKDRAVIGYLNSWI